MSKVICNSNDLSKLLNDVLGFLHQNADFDEYNTAASLIDRIDDFKFENNLLCGDLDEK